MTTFKGLSEIQKIKYKEISGCEYQGSELKGYFRTMRPHDEDWNLSPWGFSFEFQPETGYLFCQLSHRMTNNRTYGWDFDGNPLDRALIESVFPSYS